MTSGRSNREYADDTREAARTLTRITRLGRWLFNHSKILRGSAERQIGIIGEAAHEIKESLPPEFQAAEPDLCDTLD